MSIARTPYDDLPVTLVEEISAAGLDPEAVYAHVALAFEEDLPGGADDVTSAAMPAMGRAVADIASRDPGVVAGLAVAELAFRFDCPVLVHAADAEWIMRPDDAIELWEGETRELGELTLLRLGGHFAGGTVLHRPEGAGTLLSGDIVQVIPDRGWVSFMYSYPNLIPLPAAEVERMAAALEPYAFDAIQGAWWETTIPHDAKAIVRRLPIEACRAHAARALALSSAAEVRALARAFVSEMTP